MPPIPTPGQLVTVRNRRFVVTGVEASTSQLDLYAELAAQSAQHLVSLQSVEDDGAGEELEVIWEIEPGTQVYEKATLPDPTRGFDDPARLGAFLDAVRWGAVASADVQHLSAPFRSGITIEDYQLDPVVRALSMPRVSLLIADDVGLGKTIEAGLVVQELILRNRARTVLVVCPAGLQIQWRDQMREKFGLEFRIVDSELMKELRRRRGLHVNPWTHFPRLITSMEFIKRDRPLRLMKEALPAEGAPAFPRRFDLLIVDEAHNVAPAGRGNIALDTLRTQAIRTVAKHFEHKLFLDAIVTLARDLPRETVDALAAAVAGAADAKLAARSASSVVTAPAARDRVRNLLERWPDGVSGASVALALRSASHMDNQHRTRQHIELVWTGPVPPGTSFRRSDQVLLEMVREAKRRITIVSFATYRVQVVHAELLAAAKRGVEVVFIVESAQESEGRVNIDPMQAIGSELAELARVYVWPREKRPTGEHGNFGLLHAKCAIADGERLLVSSANFTAAALGKNMELGVLIEGGEVPGVVEGHWEGLRTAGILSARTA